MMAILHKALCCTFFLVFYWFGSTTDLLLAQGCSGLGNLTLNVVPVQTATISAPTQICVGASGTIAVNESFNSYAWNTGAAAQSININAGGTYTVTVTNAGGCTSTATVNVQNFPEAQPNITQNTYACDGAITLNAGPFSSYAWSNGGGNSQNATYNSSGTYTVTVTNASGCTGTDQFTVSIPAPPVTSITGNLSFCTGLSTTLTATGGFSSYSWSSGTNSANTTINAAGTYTVTVTDGFGCTDTESATVVTEPSPVPIVNNAVACLGGTVELSVANAPFQSYSWNNGNTSSSTTVNGPGDYAVTVTAANGCTGVTTAQVTPLPQPLPIITQAVYTCDGQINLSVGAGFVTYDWSNGTDAPNISVNSPGFYSVTVTNNFGCTGTDQFEVDIPPVPLVNISGDNSFCAGFVAELSATPGFASYSWSNGDNSPEIGVVNSGTYTVTATDAFGCTATDNIVVTELNTPQPMVVGPTSICAGTVTSFNTDNNYNSYAWSNGQNTPTITLSSAGTYTVTVTATNGCTGTDSETLSVLPSPSPSIVQAPYTCNSQLTISTESGFSTYVWSNGDNTASTTVLVSGTYSVTVSNAQGCTGTQVINVDIPPPPVVDISGESSICPGNSSTLIATGGYNQYVWSNNSFDPQINVTTGGNYTVTVTDNFGCTTSGEFSVSQLSAPTPNISGPVQICATGNATFSVPGSFNAYLWSTGDNTPTISVNTAGTYSVTVTATNGCTGTDTQTLTISNTLLPQITESPYTCNGQITLDAGTGYNSYTWAGGETTQNLSILTNGSYTVSVSDASGCTGSATLTVNIPSPPAVGISGNNNLCAGAFTTLNASPGLNAYIWSDGQVGESISINMSGTYTVTATDAFGCTVTSSFQFNNSPVPQPAITGSAVICTNSVGTLGLSTPFNQYLWSTGETASSIIIDSAATYMVTVTDALGCTGTDALLVEAVSALNPVVEALPYACNGSQTLEVGPGFTSYLWSGGQNTPNIVVSSPGLYAVTVTDNNGCTGTGTLNISIPIEPQVVITGPISFCQNTTVSLEASPGFTSYLWNTGALTSSLMTDTSGTYTVTVTDNLGCTDTANIVVTAQALPQPQITGPAAICAGTSATLGLSQSFSAYIWESGETTASITVGVAGTFTLTVTDANGCTGSASATLGINQNPTVAITTETYVCDGQITLTVAPGFSTYTWAGPNGFSNNTAQPTISQSGTYTVTISDANGCTSSAVQDAVVPALTQVLLNGPTQVCIGAVAELSASAGFSNYTWSDGSLLPNLTVNVPGTYTVTATDALGCSSTATLSIGNFPAPAPAIAGPQTVCPGNNALLSVNDNFVSYNWSTGETTSMVTVQPPVTATVTVTDTNGCTETASATVVVSNQLSPNIVLLPYACDGQITLDAGIGFPLYNWSNAATTPLISVSQSGTYTVTVSDGNGCSGTASVQAIVPGLPTVIVSGSSQICAGQSAALTASSGFVSYAWSNGESTPVITTDQTNTYSVTATDANGCTASASFVLGSTPPLAPVLEGNTSICPGNASIFSVLGSYSSYNWSNGESTASISVSIPGNYVVSVTDVNGCTGTAAIDLNLSPEPTPGIAGANLFCPGSSTNLTADAGFTMYAWSNGGNSFSINIQAAGSYTVTVTNASGCTGSAETEVFVAPPTTVVIDGGGVICAGNNATLSAVGSVGTLLWSNGATGSAITISQAGNYAVTVTDINGCTATDQAVLNVEEPVVTTLNNSSCRIQDAGTQSFTLSAINGCDSVVSIITTYQPSIPGILDLDTEIDAALGELVTLNVTGSFQIDSVSYSSPFGLSCSNCLNPSLTATESGFIQVTAFDADGCQTTEEIKISIKEALGIYVPNVFKPGSTENGFFSIFSAASITSVQNFNVFDRWGNALFSRADMPTNDPAVGWDGTFRGQPMLPGVYVYYFEVKLADGSVEVYSGDITILQ